MNLLDSYRQKKSNLHDRNKSGISKNNENMLLMNRRGGRRWREIK